MYLLKILVSTFDYKSKEIILNFEISVQLIQSVFEIVAVHQLQQLSQVFDVFQSSRVQMIREAHCVNQKRQLSHQVREFVVHDELPLFDTARDDIREAGMFLVQVNVLKVWIVRMFALHVFDQSRAEFFLQKVGQLHFVCAKFDRVNL